MSHSSLSTYRPGLYKLCLCTALCLRNLGNCALTSNERKSSQRFLRGCSQVITLSLNRVRFSISFLNQLVKFFVTIFYLHLSFLFFILEIIIYFFSSPNYENLQKKKKNQSLHAAQFRLRVQEVRAWITVATECSPAGKHWHLKRSSPSSVLLPSEMLRVFPCHLTPHSWGIRSPGWYRRFLGLGIMDFFLFLFFFLPSC